MAEIWIFYSSLFMSWRRKTGNASLDVTVETSMKRENRFNIQ
jgi:hypothetical protein